MAERLFYILTDLRPSSAPLLIAFIRGVPWADIDDLTRQVILHEISSGIIKLRVANGFAPFDDGLGDRPSVFHIIREILFPAAPTGAEPGFEVQQHNLSGIGKCLAT
jgi:hypothetical protein